jgi:hypothetical protein
LQEFEVKVNRDSTSIPKPIMELIAIPDSIKFVIRKSNKIEVISEKRSTANIKRASNTNK